MAKATPSWIRYKEAWKVYFFSAPTTKRTFTFHIYRRISVIPQPKALFRLPANPILHFPIIATATNDSVYQAFFTGITIVHRHYVLQDDSDFPTLWAPYRVALRPMFQQTSRLGSCMSKWATRKVFERTRSVPWSETCRGTPRRLLPELQMGGEGQGRVEARWDQAWCP